MNLFGETIEKRIINPDLEEDEAIALVPTNKTGIFFFFFFHFLFSPGLLFLVFPSFARIGPALFASQMDIFNSILLMLQ